VNDFLWGAISAFCVAIAVRFAWFWRNTRDRLFLLFSLAFCAFGLNFILIEALHPADEARQWFYLLRLLAFVLIIAAIADKNFERRRD
jgi:hypothetical protein